MKIDCLHGYYIFREDYAGEASEFMDQWGLTLVKVDDYYTFDGLLDAPDYSIEGAMYLGAPAGYTFEGPPWEVMRENGLVYNWATGRVVSLDSILIITPLTQVGTYFRAGGMIVGGSLTEEGKRITDYAAHYSSGKFKYSEVAYE